ncbi:protein preY, mitochondrial-like [Scleropages formosus]|nr:protein preY, mitochondrial-like [Scleropages formosus]
MISISGARPLRTSGRHRTDGVKDAGATGNGFDTSLLEVLVCPLSKKTLRYDGETNELINDELGIAYPIIDGIPNMIPQDARKVERSSNKEEPTQS